jgi:hypothetical protein
MNERAAGGGSLPEEGTQEVFEVVAVAGGVWATRPVSEVPELQLSGWQIWQTERGERHFVGYNETEGEGRVSSSIQAFDGGNMRGVTRSGRVYELVGPPGHNGDAAYVWARWQRINRVVAAENVTAEVLGAEAS